MGEQHGGEQRDDRADAEREREPLHARGRQYEEDERRQQGDDVRVDDRRDALAVALGDRGQQRASRPCLLLYSLEDDDVGVGGDSDRQHQAGDAGKGERDRDQLHQREEDHPVDGQTRRCDHAEQAVIGDQEQHHHRQSDDPGPQSLVECLLAERGGDGALADQREVDRQRADLQEVRKVLRRADREVAGDLGAGLAVDPLRVLVEVDDRLGDDLVVQDDREVLRILRGSRGAHRARRRGRGPPLGDHPGHLLERGTPCVGEVEGDVWLVARRLEVLLGVGDVVAGKRGPVLEHVLG